MADSRTQVSTFQLTGTLSDVAVFKNASHVAVGFPTSLTAVTSVGFLVGGPTETASGSLRTLLDSAAAPVVGAALPTNSPFAMDLTSVVGGFSTMQIVANGAGQASTHVLTLYTRF